MYPTHIHCTHTYTCTYTCCKHTCTHAARVRMRPHTCMHIVHTYCKHTCVYTLHIHVCAARICIQPACIRIHPCTYIRMLHSYAYILCTYIAGILTCMPCMHTYNSTSADMHVPVRACRAAAAATDTAQNRRYARRAIICSVRNMPCVRACILLICSHAHAHGRTKRETLPCAQAQRGAARTLRVLPRLARTSCCA